MVQQPIETAHLEAMLKIPPWASWELTPRTDLWIMILCMEQLVPAAPPRDLTMDLEKAYRWKQCRMSIPDANLKDVERGCNWVYRAFVGDKLKFHLPIFIINWKPELVQLMKRQSDFEAACLWVHDDTYTGKGHRKLTRTQVQNLLRSKKVVYVYDCDSAETFLPMAAAATNSDTDNNYYLGACSSGETLPDRDLFSKCLSMPVHAAYEWHCRRTDRADKIVTIPGTFDQRRTLLGQLNWVLTMLVNAMAEELLPRAQYVQLFCTDLMMGTIFRRFLVAQRIMETVGCHTVSIPRLPDYRQHRLWAVWDQLMDATIELAAGPALDDYPIIRNFFRIVLDGHYTHYPKFLLWAMTQSQECTRALDALPACWDDVAEDPELRKNFVNHIMFLLGWTNVQIRKKATECLTKILVNEPTSDQFMLYREDINLCVNFEEERNPEQRGQKLFLQLMLERNSTSDNPVHKQTLRTTCSELIGHTEAVVRTWSILLAASLSDGINIALRNRFEGLLNDPVPKVRAAALESWLPFCKRLPADHDMCINRMLTMLDKESSMFVRRNVAEALISLVMPDKIKDLIAVCKQEATSAKQPETSKSKGKGKAKQQQQPKKGQAQQSNKPDNALARAWRVMVALQTDPDQTVADLTQSLVTFVKERLAELESDGKRKRKKSTADANAPAFTLPTVQPLHTRLRQDLLLGKEEISMVSELRDKTPSSPSPSPQPQQQPNPALPTYINLSITRFPAQAVPEMVRLGSERQVVTVCPKTITWRDVPTKQETTFPTTGRVTSIAMDPAQLSPPLLVGCHDGSVRMWTFDVDLTPTMTMAWQALYDFDSAPTNKTFGLSMTLLGGGSSQLIVGGDTKYLRRWDLENELVVGDISIGTDQAITRLTSGNGSGNNVLAGLENGTVRLYDLRADADGRIAVGPKHGSPVRAVSLRPDGQTLVSVCNRGSVHLVDMRKMIPARMKWSAPVVPVDVDIHNRLDLVGFAGGNYVRMHTLEGQKVWDLNGFESVCFGFHPKDALLVAGYNKDGGLVALFGEKGAF